MLAAGRLLQPARRQHPRQRPLVRQLRLRCRPEELPARRHTPRPTATACHRSREGADMRRTRVIGIGAGLAVVAVAATSGVMALDDQGRTTVTAYFDRAIGVYAGSDLRVLGVRVGTVESVDPDGTEVRVTLRARRGRQGPRGRARRRRRPQPGRRPVRPARPRLQRRTAARGRRRTAAPRATPHPSRSTSSTRRSPSSPRRSARTAPTPTGRSPGLLDTGAKNLDGNGKAIGDTIEQFGKADQDPRQQQRRPVRHAGLPPVLHHHAQGERRQGPHRRAAAEHGHRLPRRRQEEPRRGPQGTRHRARPGQDASSRTTAAR